MDMTSILFAILFYFATLLFVVGLLYRINTYARTPAPLKIPTTPAPITKTGMVLRMAREVVLFESLFKGNLWTWGMGWLFHASMALVLLRHLRYFTEQPAWIPLKVFFLGGMRSATQPLPADSLLYLHLAMVALLLIIFPVSK